MTPLDRLDSDVLTAMIGEHYREVDRCEDRIDWLYDDIARIRHELRTRQPK